MIREYAGTNVSVINTLERSRINKLLNTQSVRSRARSLTQFGVSFRFARRVVLVRSQFRVLSIRSECFDQFSGSIR